MKSTRRLTSWIPAATAALALAIVQPCAAVPPNPTPLDLGVLPGCVASEAYDINAAGQVVGMSSNETVQPPVFLPFIWQDGVMSQLPLPDGCTDGTALAINTSGVVVGACGKDAKPQACVWTPGRKGWTVTLLGNPIISDPFQPDMSFIFTEHMALKINRAGQILVLATLVIDEVSSLRLPVIWHDGAWTFLTDGEGAPVGTDDPRLQLNDSGQVLFLRGNDDGQGLIELWLWDGGVARQLVTDPNWANFNNSGQVVGVCYNKTEYQQNFTYDAASKELILWPASTRSPASDTGYYLVNINDSGQVAVVIPTYNESGYVNNETQLGLTTFAGWSPAAGVTVFGTVNSMVESATLNVNAAGEISGHGFNSGTAFFASAAAGVVALGDRVAGAVSVPLAMNTSGEIAGYSEKRAVLWCAGVAVGEAKATRKGKTVTVTVTLINTSTTRTAANVVVTSASLDGGSLASPLPSIRSLAPGARKSVTISFTSDTVSGNQPFTLAGTSSLGGFSAARIIAVP